MKEEDKDYHLGWLFVAKVFALGFATGAAIAVIVLAAASKGVSVP